MHYLRHICLLYRETRRGLIALFPLVLLFIVSASPLDAQVSASAVSQSVAEEQDFAFAYGLYKDNLYQQALDQFNTFVEQYPKSLRRSEAEFLAIDCRYRLQQYADVIRLLTRYVNDYPASQLTDDAYFRLGETQLKLKNIPEAIAAFKTVLDNFGDRELAGEAAYWIGEASVRVEDYDNALKYYTLAYEHFPNNRLRDYAVYSIAWTHQQKKAYVKAIEWYERLMKEFSQSNLVSASIVRVGECYYYVNDYQNAIRYLTSARPNIKEAQEQAEADYVVAEAFYHLEQYADAQQRYEEFLVAHPGNRLEREVIYALGWSLLKQKKYAQAAGVFDRLTVGSDALAHAGLYRRGVATRLAGDRRSALQIFQEVASRSPKGEFSDNALYDAGVILYEDKDYAAARKFFEQVYQQYPSSEILADVYRMAGECWVAEASFDRALEMFNNALKQPNISTDVRVGASYQAAWSLYKLRRYEEAAERFGLFARNYSSHPQAADASFWRGEALYQTGNYDGAITAYQMVANLANHERKEEALYGIAWSYYKLNDFAKARQSFDRLLAAFPNGKFVFDARIRLGDCYYFSKDYKSAAAAYRTVTRQFAQREGVDYAVYQLGQTYFRDGDAASATQQFSTLIRSYPTSSLVDDAQYALGWILFQRKVYADAIKEFQKVISNFPSSELVPRALYSIGDSHYNLQQYVEAEKAYRQVIERFPQSPLVADALSGIQYCLLAQGKQQEAVRVIDQYIEANPGSGIVEELHLKKADLLYNQKQYAAALNEFQLFATKYPNSRHAATALFWSAKSLAALNRLPEAASTFERAAGATGATAQLAANALLEAGQLYFRQKHYDQVLRVFSSLESKYPASEPAAEASYLKGRIFLENGDEQEAKSRFEFVIQKHPTSDAAARSKVMLAQISLKAGDVGKAQTYAQEVATSRNDEIGAEAQYLIASMYAERRDWQNAVTAYLRVRYVFPSFEEWVTKAYLGLGIAYENLNDIPKAREAYQNALKLKKDEQSVAEAQRRLSALERR